MSLNNQSREYLWALRMLLGWREDVFDKTFSAALFSAIDIADHFQKAKLAKSFPVEFAAYCAWANSGVLDSDRDRFLQKLMSEATFNSDGDITT
jgi:hypothetical protein